MKTPLNVTLAIVLTAGLALVAGPASAAESCTPADAWQETIIDVPYESAVPAVGEPTITIPNPDHVPAQPATPAVGTPTVIVTNPDYRPAVPEVTELSHTEYEYKWWGAQGHGTKVWGVTAPTTRLNDVKEWTWTGYVYGTWKATGASKKIIDRAYVPAVPAQGEPQIEVNNPDYVPATPEVPAVGEPTITVSNPDYVAAVPEVKEESHVVDHDAIVCDPEPTDTVQPTAPTLPAQAAARTTEAPKGLAETGTDVPLPLIAIAGLLVAGGAFAAFRKRSA